MKRIAFGLIALSFMLMIPFLSFAIEPPFAVEPCSEVSAVVKIKNSLGKDTTDAERALELLKAISNYQTYSPALKSNNNNQYEICSENISISIGNSVINIVKMTHPEFDGTFAVNVKDGDSIFIKGIQLNYAADVVIPNAKPLISITSSGQPGNINVRMVNLTGIMSSPCLNAAAPGIVMDSLTAKSCSTAILVNAPNVKITNSEIAGNLLGIIAQNVAGTKLENTLIYDNDDGEPTSEVMGEDALQISFSLGPMFYDVIKNNVDIVEDGIDPIVFAEKAIVMLPVRIEEQKPSLIQLFTSKAGKCTSKTLPTGQACDFVRNDKNEPLKINVLPSEIEGKSLEVAVPPAYRMEQLVMLYTDPVDGTSNFSRPFIVGQGGVVAFVSSPFDMTTSGGSGMDGLDAANVENHTVDLVGMGTGSSGSSGGGVDVVGATAASGGCGKAELVPGGKARTVDVAMALWWILFSAAMLGSIRLTSARRATVRTRRH